MWWWIIGAAAGGALLTLIIQNFTTSEKKIAYGIAPDFGIADPQFRNVVNTLLGPPLVSGNRIGALQNGDAIFPAMLSAIRTAERSICFETYIYWSGEIGREFSEALAERAQAGVQVKIILDGLGTGKLEHALIDRMREAGAIVERYHPISWWTLPRINNRTHRKLLIVDGRIGFTGGVGIADQWRGDAQDERHWRDSHFRVEGPVVAQMQAVFMDNWLKTRAEVLHSEAFFPPIPDAGGLPMQVFRSSPDEGSESARLMYLLSIAAARRTLRIANAYFVPDDLAVRTLCAAAQRGVRIQVIVPGPLVDTKITRRASRARWGPLLQAGIEIHEFQPTMFHCKVMVVDDLWVSVGSTNFDSRSFRLNAEANLNILDGAFAAEQIAVFEGDLRRSRRITHDAWRARPLGERCSELLALLVRSQL